ncbi:hypothetical protein [Spirillospora sp. CA-128828]|uniref:hypothetical protein n=1 Tax=Spirillospora sp. CA-128828 TaxID=3240033 RepID=UPI003D8DADDD
MDVTAVEPISRPQVSESKVIPTFLTLCRLTGNSKWQIECKARNLARQCIGPDARIQVEFNRGLSNVPLAHLNTTATWMTTCPSV